MQIQFDPIVTFDSAAVGDVLRVVFQPITAPEGVVIMKVAASPQDKFNCVTLKSPNPDFLGWYLSVLPGQKCWHLKDALLVASRAFDEVKLLPGKFGGETGGLEIWDGTLFMRCDSKDGETDQVMLKLEDGSRHTVTSLKPATDNYPGLVTAWTLVRPLDEKNAEEIASWRAPTPSP